MALPLSRTGALALASLAVVGAGAVAARSWPSSEPALECPPEQVRWVRSGDVVIATCSTEVDAVPRPAAQLLSLGGKLDLNRASEGELAVIPGIGPTLARALVAERQRAGGFRSWDDVDRVRGVGPAKAEVLKSHTELGP